MQGGSANTLYEFTIVLLGFLHAASRCGYSAFVSASPWTSSERLRIGSLPVAMLWAAAGVAAQALPPGATRWSPDGYVEYILGNAPIIVSAGHGGDLRPTEIPDRTYGTFAKDSRTLELAREFASSLTTRFGLQPHVILCHLHRRKLDVNREIVEAAQGDPLATATYQAFHQACTDARNTVTSQWGVGMYLDLHGHGHPENWIELGYTLTSSQLALPNSTLALNSYITQSTLRSVGSLPGVFFPEILRGPSSLGGHLQSGGYDSVPGPVFPDPNGGNYFNGGYNVATYGSRNGGSVDGIQIEAPWSVRSSVMVRTPFLHRVGSWLDGFFPQYRNILPQSGPRISVVATDRIASETGGRAAFVLRRTGSTSAPRFVTLQYGGTATYGIDYTAPAPMVSFAIGQSELLLPILPLDDGLAEGSETIRLSILGGSEVAMPNAAEILLLDDEPNDELVVHLPLDTIANGNTPDLSGNQRIAALLPAGSGPTTTSGMRGQALRFDGVDDRVRLTDFPHGGTTGISLAFWFRTSNANGTGFRYLVSHGAANTPHRLGVYFDQSNGHLRSALIHANNLTSLDVLDVTRDLRDGQWHHYALVTTTRELVRVYIDGEPATAAQFLGDALDPNGDFVLGARSDLASNTFAAVDLDDFRLYGRPLSPIEVQLLHSGSGREAMVYPGTGEDLVLATGVGGLPSSGPGNDVKPAPGGSLLLCSMGSGTGALHGAPTVLIGDLHGTGHPLQHPMFANVYTSAQPLVLHGPFVLGQPGSAWMLSLPTGFAGLSLVLQPLALWPTSANGLFAAGDAHELRMQ